MTKSKQKPPGQTTFVAVYRGQTISSAKLIAVSADPALVAHVVDVLLRTSPVSSDPVQDALEQGRQAALRVIASETQDD